ncbi:MAG TPA: OmpA family protein [Tepidisphaeraceae bacterium]|jgi:chemotaxis protein MotB
MPRLYQWVSLAVLSFSLTGCVAQEKYNALKMERDRYAAQLAEAARDASSARSESEAYQKQLRAIMDKGGNSEAMILNLTQQNGELQKALDDMQRKYADALNSRPMGEGPLPAVLSDALERFAQANPNLVEFDRARGIVKFKSDVTFARGSAELTANAKQAIDQFATILNGGASGYELMVAGHTDNTRVVNPETIAAGHKDNWYLSAHRGISVAQELMHNNVGAQRIGVAGYAEQRPVAANDSEANRAKNRRVEVLILPTTSKGPAITSSGIAPHRATAVPAANRMNKDTVPEIQRPRMDK